MGFSLIGAFAIIGISIIICSDIFAGTLLPSVTEFDYSYKEMVKRCVERIQTNINITNVVTSINGSNYDHNISLENTGSTSLKISDLTVMINGTIYQFNCSDTYLYPPKETNLYIYNLSGSGEKKLTINTENGISDYYNYVI